MKRGRLLLVAAALTLIVSVAVKPAIAYFTDTVTVSKTVELSLGDGTVDEMDDDVEHMIKTISIKNTGEYDIYVRAKAIYPEKCTVTYQTSTNWTDLDGGYYYYENILKPGEKTDDLHLKIEYTGETHFNVIIIQEATKVIYDADGNPKADWSSKITEETETTPEDMVVESR